MRGRLLIVTFHCPPRNSVGGLRWWGLAKYLARMGWAVDMIVEGTDSGDPPESPEGIRVFRIPRRTTLQDRYRTMRLARTGGIDRSSSPSGEKPRSDETRNSWATKLRREAGEALRFPDDARGWITHALRRGVAVIRASPPDVIISSGPPHSAHLIARGLARRANARHFVDYRDPWPGDVPNQTVAEITFKHLERLVVRGATGLLATTPELAELLRQRYPRIPIHWIPNGVDAEQLPLRERNPGRGVRIVHVGTLYFFRDPRPLFDAFRQFIRIAPDVAAGSELHLIGSAEPPYQAMLDEGRADPILGPHLRVTPSVPRDEALRFLACADIAVVLAQSQPALVPAKIYESVALGVPTLVITEDGSASAETAQRIGAVHCDPHDTERLARLFAEAKSGAWNLPPRTQPITHTELAQEVDAIIGGPRD